MVAPGATGGRADHLSRPVNSRGRSLIWTHFCSSRSASNRHQPESSDGRLFDRTNRRIRPAIPDQWLRSYNTMQAPMTAEPTSTPSTANAVRIEDITVRIPESERREPNHGWRGTQLPSPERPMLHGVSNTVRVSGRVRTVYGGLGWGGFCWRGVVASDGICPRFRAAGAGGICAKRSRVAAGGGVRRRAG